MEKNMTNDSNAPSNLHDLKVLKEVGGNERTIYGRDFYHDCKILDSESLQKIIHYVDCIENGILPDGKVLEYIATCFKSYLEGTKQTLDSALGLKTKTKKGNAAAQYSEGALEIEMFFTMMAIENGSLKERVDNLLRSLDNKRTSTEQKQLIKKAFGLQDDWKVGELTYQNIEEIKDRLKVEYKEKPKENDIIIACLQKLCLDLNLDEKSFYPLIFQRTKKLNKSQAAQKTLDLYHKKGRLEEIDLEAFSRRVRRKMPEYAEFKDEFIEEKDIEVFLEQLKQHKQSKALLATKTGADK